MNAVASLLFAASLSGEAALRHAARLSALGPHPWGSPRVSLAARYIEAQFKDAGLQEVRLQPFESHGIAGENVIGMLRGRGEEFLVVASHHDTAPDAPGAYDAGGGVGVLIETARLLARDGERSRTLVFASFDGEEAWSTGKTTLAGSRAYLKSLGADARNLLAAVVVGMCGWSGGTPTLHALAYADPLGQDESVIAPRWLVEAASRGARSAGEPLKMGDPLIPWLYQPGVRVFRADFYGDDKAFLQAGLPALFVSDSSFTRFYPHHHQPQDTADKLDALALERMGRAVSGAVRALERAERGAAESQWFSAFGVVLGVTPLLALGALSVVPGLRQGLRAGGRARTARLLHFLLFGFLASRHPVPTLFVLLAPNLLPLVPRRSFTVFLALLPALLLVGLGIAALPRGFVHGTFLTPWEVVAAAGALGLALLPVGRPTPRPGKARRKGVR